MQERERRRGGVAVERMAEERPVGDREGRIEVRRQKRIALERRRARRRSEARVDAADVGEEPGRLGEAEPEQVGERARGGVVELRDGGLRLREPIALEAAEQATVDEDEAVDVPVARVAIEVPARVGDGHRGAERVAAEDHLPAPAVARREHHLALVVERERQAPLLGERVLASVEEVEVVGGRSPVGEPAQVVVEHLLERHLAGQRLLEDAVRLERLAATVDRPDLEVRDLVDEVLGVEGEVAGAAHEAGHQHEHALGRRGPELAHEDLVVLRRPRPVGAVDRDVANGGGRRGRRGQEAGGGESRDERPCSHRAKA